MPGRSSWCARRVAGRCGPCSASRKTQRTIRWRAGELGRTASLPMQVPTCVISNRYWRRKIHNY